MQQGMIDAKQLEELADAGEIDTVLCMFTDFQGRFVGKRILPHFFLEDVMGEEGLHACLYLIAIDMEMEPLPGFEYASWETGYGDFKMIPDMSTLRLVPWLEKTAMVICDVADEHTGELVEVAPRTILKRQVERAKQAGYTFKTGSELEFYLFKESYDEAAQKRYQDLQPSSPYIMDYHMLQTTKDEWLIRQIRNNMYAAGIPIEFSKGEFGKGQHEINITYADALATADYHAIYKHGVKEIAALNGAAITFMAKWTMAEAGSSCHMHASVWNEDGSESLMWSDDDPNHMSETCGHFLGGLDVDGAGDGVDVRAVRELVQAVPARILGADGDPVEPRQPDVRVPGGRGAQRVPRRVPHPRRRREPVPGLRRDDRERTPRDREQGRVPSAVRGERLRVEGRGARPLVAPRSDRRDGALRGDAGGVRRLRVRAPAEHGPAGADHLRQPDRDRLGARPVLRTRLAATHREQIRQELDD